MRDLRFGFDLVPYPSKPAGEVNKDRLTQTILRRDQTRRPAAVSLSVAPILLLFVIGLSAVADDPAGSLTWTRDVEPLIRARCASCHAADGPALPRLATYEDVVANAAAVKAAVMARRMPIWAPARGVNRFQRDPSLSPFQISQIASWVESRTPRGAPMLAPVPAAGANLANLPLPEGRSIALELTGPSSPTGVDRQIIRIPADAGDSVVAWRFEPGDPTLREALFGDGAGRRLWTWIPGLSGENFPAGTALSIGSATLIVETSRRTLEVDGRVRVPKRQPSRLRLWLARQASRRLEVLSVPCGTASPIAGHVHAIRPSSPGASPIALREEDRGGRRIALFTARAYPLRRTYWLREPADLRQRRLAVEGSSCEVELLISRPAR